MNGNFSFGDYFKHDAIAYAWELLTGPVEGGRYGLDPEKLWATVYEDDDEAEALWLELTDIPKERIVRRDRLDNYWHMGIPGPGGPCSEIFYDRGPRVRPGRRPDGRRGPLPGDLEPRLHRVRARRGPEQGRLRHRRTPAEEERRHRHGPGADRQRPPGRRQPLRDRPGPAGARPGGRDDGQALRRSAQPRRVAEQPRRRSAAGRRRPRAVLPHAHRRRRDPRQRGPRLRAAPDAAPRRALDAAARLGRAGHAHLLPVVDGADERHATPSCGPTSTGSARSRMRRRRRSVAPSPPGRPSSTPRWRG